MTKTDPDLILKNYDAARKTYASFGIDTDAASTGLAT